MKKVILFLNYWIFAPRDTEGRRRHYSLREAWETATIMSGLKSNKH